jgi:hypothetical protein
MSAPLLDLLQRQQRNGFADLAGSNVAATIPVSERLINEMIAELLSPGGKVREIRVRAEESNHATAEIRLSRPSFLPAIPVKFAIEHQPEMPAHSVLELRLLQSSALFAKAVSPLLPSLPSLPPGIEIEGDRIRIDIRRLLAEGNNAGWLDYVTDLRVNTRAGAIVLDIRATIRSR